ncbi:MAG: hemerythrin domain-containing protein [Burkholderiales bacterium]
MFGIGESDTSALKLLKKDHDEVDALFKEYESGKDDMKPVQKEKLSRQICDRLTIHATIEEEVFYPAVRNASEDLRDLVSEAAVEHQSLKDIIGRLESAPVSDPLYDAGVKVLSEYVKHHVREEEGELFSKVRSSDVDLEALGERLQARKAELMTEDEPARSARRGDNGSGKRQPARASAR